MYLIGTTKDDNIQRCLILFTLGLPEDDKTCWLSSSGWVITVNGSNKSASCYYQNSINTWSKQKKSDHMALKLDENLFDDQEYEL